MEVTVGSGSIRGDAAAELLFSDWAVMEPGSELVLDSPEAIAGAVWRIGDDAIALVAGAGAISSAEAVRAGLCDAVGTAADFRGNRSDVALDAAAALVSGRGGDALERATFAWLFATGVPREGLTAFLEKRPPRF